MSPTQRTLKRLRKLGAVCQVVERWNSYAQIRQDLFGGIDVVALEAGKQGVLGVQACAVASQSARITKLQEEPKLAAWVLCGNRLEVWGWGKRRNTGLTKAGKPKKGQVWVLTVSSLVMNAHGQWLVNRVLVMED